jgi:pilus assembly protein TadC
VTAIILAGALAGLGLAMVLAWLVPAQPDLASALDRLDPAHARTQAPVPGIADTDLATRVGLRLQRQLPARILRVPTSDLAVLGISPAGHLGTRAGFFVVGLVFPSLFTAVLWAFGWALPLSIPTLAGPLLGAGMSVIPNLEVSRRAAVARSEFARAVGAYTDLVALERQAGAGTAQALEAAATVGDSWVFVRIREELARARWSGRAPWDALSDLGSQIQVSGLGDLGDIMRLSGEQGSAAVDALRARAAASRDALLASKQAQANRASEGLVMPVAALGITFLVLLAAPAVLRIAQG